MADFYKATELEVSVSDDPAYLDLDERRKKALQEIDNAKFGWFHVRACLVSGIGFFTDAYDIFAINIASQIIGFVYFQDNHSKTPDLVDFGLKVSAPVGTFCGQLFFGWLADQLGRKKMYGVELLIIVIATLGSSLAANAFAVSTIGIIIFWRVLLGIGIGGDYPLSAVITSEFASTAYRGAMMATVFAMQGFGNLAAALVSMVVLVSFKDAINSNVLYADYCWRLLIGLGCVPAMIAVYFRMTIPETPRYTMDVNRDINKGVIDAGGLFGDVEQADELEVVPVKKSDGRATFGDLFRHFGQWKHLKVLLGCSISWFALDVAFYGLGLNNSIVLTEINLSTGSDPWSKMWINAVGNFVINLLGNVPGYWITVFTIEKLGRKKIQFMGFALLTVIFLILGAGYDAILSGSTISFVVLYTIANLFFNFGPNATTFIVPGEVFPTKYRSTGHGLSAASGKAGAIFSQALVYGIKQHVSGTSFLPPLLLAFSAFMFIGLLSTFLIPETKGRSLEEISGED